MAYFLNTFFLSLPETCTTLLVTLAITMIFKTSYTTNFAQGTISAFGAYVVSAAVAKLGLPFWISIPLGMLVSMLMAVAIDVVIFRNGRYVNALSKQIITMGLISVILGSIPLIFGISDYNFNSFVSGDQTIKLLDGTVATIQNNALVCIAITAVVIVLIFILLHFSKWGLAVRATASNEYIAGMMGINTHVITAISWGLAGALGVLAASLYLSSGSKVNGYFMTPFQVNAFLAGILGGFSTFHGPVIAAFLIYFTNNLIICMCHYIGNDDLGKWSTVIVYALAITIIFFKPQGMFGKKIAKKV